MARYKNFIDLKRSFLAERDTRTHTLSGYYFNVIDHSSDWLRSTITFKCRSNFSTQGYEYVKDHNNYFYYDIYSNRVTGEIRTELCDAQIKLTPDSVQIRDCSFTFLNDAEYLVQHGGQEYRVSEFTSETQDANWFFAGFTNLGFQIEQKQIMVSQLRYLSPLFPYKWGRVSLADNSLLKIFNYTLASGIRILGHFFSLTSIKKHVQHIVVKGRSDKKYITIWLKYTSESSHTYTTHNVFNYSYNRYDIEIDKIETNTNVPEDTTGRGVFEITTGIIF